jgi:putative ABC transport system substrate-binding protein
MTARREFIAAVVSLVFGGCAQQRTYRLAYLSPVSAAAGDPGYPTQKALFGRLAELGYQEGHNLVVDRRFAEGRLDRLPMLAADLVARKPDVLLAVANEATLVASKATRTLPIVFVAVSDPVTLGVVKSLRRSGTNATGLSDQAEELQIKVLQLIKEVFPSASEVAVLHDPRNTVEAKMISDLRHAGAAMSLRLRIVELQSPEHLATVIGALRSHSPDVLYVMGGPLAFSQRERLTALVNSQQQPAVYSAAEFVEAGGLMSYSTSLSDQFRGAATLIDKILKGESPAELPVEQPTRFELVLNLRTARLQRISFPAPVRLRADRSLD